MYTIIAYTAIMKSTGSKLDVKLNLKVMYVFYVQIYYLNPGILITNINMPIIGLAAQKV